MIAAFPDSRPLTAKVAALAERFRAQEIGHRKNANASIQLAENCARDAAVLEQAVIALRGKGPGSGG